MDGYHRFGAIRRRIFDAEGGENFGGDRRIARVDFAADRFIGIPRKRNEHVVDYNCMEHVTRGHFHVTNIKHVMGYNWPFTPRDLELEKHY